MFVKKPWDPRCNVSPEIWDRVETNRIVALGKKHRHSFPSAAPVIPSKKNFIVLFTVL